MASLQNESLPVAMPGPRRWNLPWALELRVAFQYLTTRRSGTLIRALSVMAILVICLSVAIPLWVMSVVAGMHDDVTSKLVAMDSHLRAEVIGAGLENYDDVVSYLETEYDDLIQLAYPYYEIRGLIRRTSSTTQSGEASGLRLKAMRPEDVARNPYIQQRFKRPALMNQTLPFQLPDPGGIFLGMGLDNQVEPINRRVELLLPIGGLAHQHQFVTLRASGTFTAELSDIDASVGLTTLDTLPEFFGTAPVANGIGIILQDSAVGDVDVIEEILRQDETLSPRFHMANTTNEGVFLDFKWQNTWIRALLFLMVGIAFLTVFITLQILVLTKRREIAVMRAYGCSEEQVRRIFMLEGLLLGVIGGMMGAGLGLLLSGGMDQVIATVEWACRIATCGTALPPCEQCSILDDRVFYQTRVLTLLSWSDVALQLGGAIVASILAAFIPAARAATVPPAILLREDS